LPERPSSACSSSTFEGRSTDLRTRGLSPGRIRIENLCLSTSRSSCSPTLPDGQAIAADPQAITPVPGDLQSLRDSYSRCSSFPQGTATSRREAAMVCGRRPSQGASYNTSCNFVARLPTLPTMSRVPPSPPRSGFIEPCLPSAAERPPSGPDWVHEIKHDSPGDVRHAPARVPCKARSSGDACDDVEHQSQNRHPDGDCSDRQQDFSGRVRSFNGTGRGV
jgi:hypothetical protein